MTEKVKKRLFSVIVIPDSGSGVKTGNFTTCFLPWITGTLAVLFVSCLFIIAGYHIKLNQEKTFKNTLNEHRKLLSTVEISEKQLNDLLTGMEQLQRNDRAFRFFENMNIYDDEMYRAGVGGHVIIDQSEFEYFEPETGNRLERISYDLVSLGNRIDLQKESFASIQKTMRDNRAISDGTPTIFPTHYGAITSRFGYRIHPIFGRRIHHDGIDIRGRRGQSIWATADGVVTFAGWRGGYGNCVVIRHRSGFETVYGHLLRLSVKRGETVKKRQVIGTMGSTGTSTGVHLHYEIAQNGRKINPVNFLLDL